MKKLFICAFAFALSAGTFARTFTASDVNDCLNSFSKNINKTLPNAATQQNVYSQAWIGKIYPSAPPHFAVGIEAGVAKLDMEPFKEAIEVFNVGGLPSFFVYPTVTANARIGGFFLPFDIGFSCMYLDISSLRAVSDGFGISLFNIGGDIRYALLKGEGAWPQLSLGFGYYYLGGKVSLNKDGVRAGLDYSTHSMFGQIQVSKTFLFFTPFLGFRGIFSKSATDWYWSVTDDRIATAASYVGTASSGKGSANSNWTDYFVPQIYGGFGLKFSFFAINISGSYDFAHTIWGGNLSLRFQM